MDLTSKSPIDADTLFGNPEALRLHQLRLLEWMVSAGRKPSVDDGEPLLSPQWESFLMYGSSRKEFSRWPGNNNASRTGARKKVAGRSRLLLVLERRCWRCLSPSCSRTLKTESFHVAIIVPTIVSDARVV